MPRPASVRWCNSGNAWRSDVGPRGVSGRRTPVYFRELPNTPRGRRSAEDRLAAYLKDRDRTEEAAVHDAANPRVWSGVVKPYLESVWALVEADKRSEETYRSHVDRLTRWTGSKDRDGVRFADRLALSLAERDCERWVEGLAAEGLGATRIAGLMQSVQACLNWAATPQRGREPRVLLPGGNPFAAVKVDPAAARVVRVSTRAEVARFLRAARAAVEPWAPTPQGQCGGCKRAGRKGRCRRSHTKRAVSFRAAILLCRLQAAMGTRPKELCEATWASQVEGLEGWTPRAWRDPDSGNWWGLICVPGKTYRKTGRARTIPVPPLLARAIERMRSAGLHEEVIFPRVSREGGPGRWSVGGLDARVRIWREAAGLPGDFQLYALRHRFYTGAVGRAGLTADQAGRIGGTSGAVVGRVYLQRDLGTIFEGAAKIRRAGKGGGQ